MAREKEAFRSGLILLWGRPNVGKSTLLNAILGRKVAIVTARPQTTRNRISGVLTTGTAQLVFVDTPGIHAPRDALGRFMVASAREALPDTDVVLFVVDASTDPGPGDEKAALLLRSAGAPVVLALNKSDLVSPELLAARREAYARLGKHTDVLDISALTHRGLPELTRRLEEMLPPGPMYYPPEMVTDHPDSFLIAELIREQALLLTQQEIPYSLAVIVEELAPRTEELIYVRAVLYVERDSQKKIIIGEGGRMLREIGRQARAQAESLLGKRLYLDLWVKVRPDWRANEIILARFGYPMPKQKKRRPAR